MWPCSRLRRLNVAKNSTMGAAAGSIMPTIITAHMASTMAECAAVHGPGRIAPAMPGMSPCMPPPAIATR